MSALPSPVSPGPFATGIKGRFIRTRASDLGVFARIKSPTTIGCLTLIGVKSVGWGKSWTQPLPMKEMVKHCNVSSDRPVQTSIAELEDEGLIERRRSSATRGYEYRRKQPIDYDGRDALGHCPSCKKVVQFTLDRDVTIPHSLFLNVQQAVDRGTFLCLLLISLETFSWQDGEIWATPKEIKIEEFCRRTDLKRSEVLADLAKAEARGLIGSSGKRGSIQTFWPIPNSWPAAGLRLPRKGGNPSPSKRNKDESKTVEISQPKETAKPTSPVEFWSRPCGHCQECPYWGPVEIVELAEKAPRKPAERARAGPIPQPFSSFEKFQRFK